MVASASRSLCSPRFCIKSGCTLNERRSFPAAVANVTRLNLVCKFSGLSRLRLNCLPFVWFLYKAARMNTWKTIFPKIIAYAVVVSSLIIVLGSIYKIKSWEAPGWLPWDTDLATLGVTGMYLSAFVGIVGFVAIKVTGQSGYETNQPRRLTIDDFADCAIDPETLEFLKPKQKEEQYV